MPTSNLAETIEQKPVFEKLNCSLRVAIAGTFLGVGVGNIILASQDYNEADQSSICEVRASNECEELLSEERNDLIAAGVGGLVLSGLAFVTMLISRKEQE